MISTNSQKTSGFDQSRSHCHSLNVVHTHACAAWSQLKFPGAKAGKTSGSVRSYRSGWTRSGYRWKYRR